MSLKQKGSLFASSFIYLENVMKCYFRLCVSGLSAAEGAVGSDAASCGRNRDADAPLPAADIHQLLRRQRHC